MPRRPRHLLGDGTYHVTARGVARSHVYGDARDYLTYLRIYRAVVHRYGWDVSAFCLMPNHYHLVFGSTREQLSVGMQRLNFLYAQYFNRRHDRVGHLFQNRFDARLVEGDRRLADVSRYVVRNPVRAGLVRRWEDWPWTGLASL